MADLNLIILLGISAGVITLLFQNKKCGKKIIDIEDDKRDNEELLAPQRCIEEKLKARGKPLFLGAGLGSYAKKIEL